MVDDNMQRKVDRQVDKKKQLDKMSFGGALYALKDGYKVCRSGWNGKGMWLKLQFPDDHSKMTLPYIYIEYPVDHIAYPDGCRVPWLASQTDMLADDWSIDYA